MYLRELVRGAAVTAFLIAPLLTAPAMAQSTVPPAKAPVVKAALVKTTYGPVVGVTGRNGVLMYRGIPYGADTGGAARFLPASEPKPWTEPLDASKFGPPCTIASSTVPGSVSPTEISENCLTVNVWTPNLTGKLPVMVNFHGGAFSGFGSNPDVSDDATRLLRDKNIVLVSIRHRLGAFGYLQLSAAFGEKYRYSGNVGLLDLAEALKWVQKNIAQFGGDPSNITVYGGSGGGAKTIHAAAMPAFKGLFQKAIILGGHNTWKRNDLKSASERTKAFLTELGIADGDIKALQSVPAARMAQAQAKLTGSAVPDASWGPRPWVPYDFLAPVIDGDALPGYPLDVIAAGRGNKIDFMMGTAEYEHWSTGPLPLDHYGWITRDELPNILRPYLGNKTESVIAGYKQMMPTASPSGMLQRIITDRDWHLPHAWLADAVNKAGNTAYYYFVENEGAHAVHVHDGGTLITGLPDGQISRAMISFAATGKPNNDDLSSWPPYTTKNHAMMVFGPETRLAVGELDARLAVWKDGR